MIRRIVSITSRVMQKLGIGFDVQNHPAVQAMEKRIRELGSLEFKVEFYPDGSWTAESLNIDGIITGSRNARDMSALIKDAVFTFFGIPAYLSQEELLKGNNEPVTMRQTVWAAQ